MKKIGLLVVFLVIISCSKKDYIIVSGKVENKVLDVVNFTSSNNTLIKSIKLSEDGSFIDTIKVAEGSFILTNGNHKVKLYLSPGDNVIINYDVNDFYNTLSFSGKGSESCNYLLSKIKVTNELLSAGSEVYLLDEGEYKAKMSNVKTTLDDLLDSGKKFTKLFKLKEKKYNNYAYLERIEKYQRNHRQYTDIVDFKVSDDFLSDLKGLSYENEEDFIECKDYNNLVLSYFSKEASKLAIKESISNEIAYLKVVKTIKNEYIRNEALYDASRYIIKYTKDLENFYREFMEISTNEIHREAITSIYDELNPNVVETPVAEN